MQYVQQFTPAFLLLQQEGHLMSTCLATGLTELRAAHVHNKGAFYSSLFNLSIGLERLLKSIVVIEHMIRNNLIPPSKKQLKQYGHDISELYDKSVEIGLNHSNKVPERNGLHEIEQETIRLLSEFAQTSRYHNLDALSNQSKFDDPLMHWNNIIMNILETDVTKHQKEKVLNQARSVAGAIEENTATIMQGLDKSSLSTVQALALPGLHEQASKFAVYRIIKIISPLRDLISELSHYAYKYPNKNPFPQMQKFLEWIWNDRQYVLRKRKWP
ncbi:MAG: hypothetical protein RNU03_12895 [Candidatus Sedimenticola sp. (ex Thyasira tokunagai)]